MRILLRSAALAAALVLAAYGGLLTVFGDPVAKTVTTAASQLTASSRHTYIKIWNTDTSKELRLGTSNAVTTTNGIPIPPGTWIEFSDVALGQHIWGITATGSLSAIVLEGYDNRQ